MVRLAMRHTNVKHTSQHHKVTQDTLGRQSGRQKHTGWAKKRGHRLMTIILSNLNRFKNFFHWKIPW